MGKYKIEFDSDFDFGADSLEGREGEAVGVIVGCGSPAEGNGVGLTVGEFVGEENGALVG